MNKFLALLLAFFLVHAANALEFPKDHGQHPKSNLEHWNFFGHLLDANHRLFGFSLTFLRLSVPLQDSPSLWTTKAIYASYFTITDNEKEAFFFQEKVNRTSFNLSGASETQLMLWNGHWQANMSEDTITLEAKTNKAAIRLNLTPVKPILLFGDQGIFSINALDKTLSYYYAFPRLKGDGSLIIAGKKYKIVAASASMDHAFQQVSNPNIFANTFIIQLDNNEEIILYLLGFKDSTLVNPQSFCVINRANGQAIPLSLADFQLTKLESWQSPDSQKSYPSSWLLTIPQYHYRLIINPTVKNQEIITPNETFWQGQAGVIGDKNGRPLAGNASIEIYDLDWIE